MGVREIITLWPSSAVFADDLGMAGRKGTRLVRMWRYRGVIPPKRFAAIVEAAVKRGFQEHVSLQTLSEANETGSGQPALPGEA